MNKLCTFWRVVFLVAGACCCLAVSGRPAVEPAQKRDPFQLPPLVTALAAAAQADQDGAEVPLASEAPRPAPLLLRAVIYDGTRSLVNINGRILAVGEALDEGYRLVEVGERHALLIKNGKELRLHMEGEVN